MNKAQFRSCRLQLGLDIQRMAEAFGVRKGTIIAMETGARPLTDGILYQKGAMTLTHIVSFATAWMLLNGGPLIPWPREEDPERLRAFRDFHGMTNNEMAALFDVSIREMEYCVSPTADRSIGKMRLMALCWMRIFGSRDPFACSMHRDHDENSASTCPLRLDPAPVINGRVVVQ